MGDSTTTSIEPALAFVVARVGRGAGGRGAAVLAADLTDAGLATLDRYLMRTRLGSILPTDLEALRAASPDCDGRTGVDGLGGMEG